MKKILFSIFAWALALPAHAQYGLKETASNAGLDTTKTSVPALVGSIIGWALSLIGVIFMGLLLYGGFLWMTSYGNSQKVDKAKDLITSAIIGLLIVVAAYAITNFVINAFVGGAPTTP